MVIANPIYDVVFKKLMQNTRIAKFFIETILEETVVEVDVKPEGLVYHKLSQDTETEAVKRALAIVRFDFVATIKTGNGDLKKVLIEIQKSRHPMDLTRFRNYLGLNYQVKDEVYFESEKKTLVLPIVTIYLLGFKLPEIKSPVICVSRQYIDQISHEVISQRNEFIEKLTHDCHVLQIPRIEPKIQTKLERLLTLFEQKAFVDAKSITKEYKYRIEDEPIREMTEILNYTILDPETKKMIDDEQEAYRVYNLAAEDYAEAQQRYEKAAEKLIETEQTLERTEKALEEKDKFIEEKDKTIEEKDKAIGEKDKFIEEKDKAIGEKDKFIEEKDKTIEEKDKAIGEKDKAIEEKDKAIEEKDKFLEESQKTLSDKEREIMVLQQLVVQLKQQNKP